MCRVRNSNKRGEGWQQHAGWASSHMRRWTVATSMQKGGHAASCRLGNKNNNRVLAVTCGVGSSNRSGRPAPTWGKGGGPATRTQQWAGGSK